MADDSKNRRLKILISAYACAPGRGSEEGVGWDCIRALAEYNDLYVITRGDARPQIEAYLARQELGTTEKPGTSRTQAQQPGPSPSKRTSRPSPRRR